MPGEFRNDWKLVWRQLGRRGRLRGSVRDPTELIPCPLDMLVYLNTPALWHELPAGKFFSFYFIITLLILSRFYPF